MIGYVNKDTIIAMCDAVREKMGTTDVMEVTALAANINLFKGGADSVNYDTFINRTIVDVNNSSVPYIGEKAFMECSELMSVCLYNVETCRAQCFSKCPKLSFIDIPKLTLIEPQVFSYDTALTYVILPASGIDIQTQAFSYCSSLHTIDIVDPIRIWGEAFLGCTSLTALVIRYSGAVTNIPLLQSYSAFSNTPIASGTGYIYVPRNLISTYQAADQWSQYANQFRAIEDYNF